MAARASTDLVNGFGCSVPPIFQNPSALAVHLSFLVIQLFNIFHDTCNHVDRDAKMYQKSG